MVAIQQIVNQTNCCHSDIYLTTNRNLIIPTPLFSFRSIFKKIAKPLFIPPCINLPHQILKSDNESIHYFSKPFPLLMVRVLPRQCLPCGCSAERNPTLSKVYTKSEGVGNSLNLCHGGPCLLRESRAFTQFLVCPLTTLRTLLQVC
ncbi:hypothetical protein CEXT_171491 [Caerostris extrusa]|uniref:Uncharacterized protein n=1 Tax=Caerostris extrusa TaxID=172846 RepID=A0AAV4QYY5_CAEEX|nr:hypothetical protein CEXT_171491 [Caerostris extrusa]